ncbi:MAG: LacI family transcriptional regulator [Firmicutes bacterium]|nr:LacI family transcriptional regulator [Bacillota bacterium]
MGVTIKDVAKEAGVSISTVSRVINNSKPVSPEIKRKVLQIIDELGYRPNEVARTLVTKKSYLIGVVVTDLGNSYIADMVRGIEEVGKMYNYDILLCSTYGEKEAEAKYFNLLDRKQVEGIILISNSLNDDIEEIIGRYKKPFVYLSRYSFEKKYPTVTINNYQAAYEMTKYLQSLGHDNIAYVSSDMGPNSVEGCIHNGYKDAIKENENGEEKVYDAKGIDVEDGYEIAKDIAKDLEEVSAVFCSTDELALGVSNYLSDNNIKVPEEVSIAGFGDINFSSVFRPRLTTIKEPYYDIGAVAIRRIIKELKEEEIEKEHITLPFQIQKRDSCLKLI